MSRGYLERVALLRTECGLGEGSKFMWKGPTSCPAPRTRLIAPFLPSLTSFKLLLVLRRAQELIDALFLLSDLVTEKKNT
jgi:hypothetical protein